jgi:hypothetical protein
MIEQGYKGNQDPNSGAGMFNAISFIAKQLISKINVATLVEVIAVTNAGTLDAVGFVDIKPLVNQVDGYGNEIKSAPVYGVPYFRMQGGANAVIIDPQVGDIGIALFSDRDISKVVATRESAMQGSWRRFSESDALYVGGVLNGVPTQYVIFNDSGVKIISPTKITLESPAIELNGAVTATSTIAATGEVTGNGKALSTHMHQVAGVQAGSSTLPTTAPV